MPRVLAWLLALPLMTAGSLAAHSLAYRIVEPDVQRRLGLLDGTGHGYLGAVPFLLGVCLALVLVGLAAHAARALRGGRVPCVQLWPFLLLPLAGFTIQEHLERLVAWGQFPASTALEPAFLVGLALQLPFALAAVLAARFLARTGASLGRALRSVPARRAPRPPAVPAGVEASLPLLPALALGHAGRAPPV